MKVYISDLDGTLLNSEIKVTKFTSDTLNRLISQGMNFTIATARTLASVDGILCDIRLNLPVILMNGVLIYNPLTSHYDVINSLTHEQSLIINKVRKSLGLECLLYTISDNKMMTSYEKLTNKNLISFVDEREKKYNKIFTNVEDFDSVTAEKIYYTFLDSYENLLPLYEQLNGVEGISMTFYEDIYTKDMWYLEAFSHKATKKNAILWLRENYNFGSAVAFGDNLNDLPMFEVCEEKYAVKNAKSEVIERCQRVIESNDQDGVARFLLENWSGK